MPEKYVIARYSAKGHIFEILVNPDLALKVKEGKVVDINELLIGDYVYKDARKGLKASPEALRSVFGTDDLKKVAIEIIKRGEINLTAEQRRKIIEEKRKQLISLIAKNAIDPKTKLPIPRKRIEIAMEQAGIAVDPFKPVELQFEEAVSKLARYIPIKIAKAYIAVKIPPQFSGKAYRVLASIGEIKKTNWLSDGSLLAEVEIPAGTQQEFIDKINELTKGAASIKILYVR
ncbi:MAG: ribosome assembly factor SBDS [Thermoprotei archaeon]|nr:MAG: ribosome assembly factor SBDS [Thermoprotei archaeon]